MGAWGPVGRGPRIGRGQGLGVVLSECGCCCGNGPGGSARPVQSRGLDEGSASREQVKREQQMIEQRCWAGGLGEEHESVCRNDRVPVSEECDYRLRCGLGQPPGIVPGHFQRADSVLLEVRCSRAPVSGQFPALSEGRDCRQHTHAKKQEHSDRGTRKNAF